MEQALELRVLGSFEVLAGDLPVEMPPSRKTRALLAYLALSDRPVRRERLCEVFWELPDDPKGALRWSLSKIRRAVNGDGADRIVADRAIVALDRDGVSIDWLELKRAAAEGLETLPDERLEQLAAPLRGGFLEDLSLPRCPDWEAWRLGEAAQVEAVAARLLRLLVDRLEPERALPHALKLRTFAPDPEEADALIDRLRRTLVRRPVVVPDPGAAPAPAGSPASPPAEDRGCRLAVSAPRSGRHTTFCTTPDGVRLAWSATGDGPPILRGPHWMTHLEYDRESPIWGPWIDELSRSNRLVRFDQRCNGLSDRGVADISLERMVEDIGTVLDAAGLDDVVLLGISQSCAYSIAYAVRHPERVRGLILYGGFAKGWRARGNPDEVARREAMTVLLRHGWGTEDPTFRQLFTAMFCPGATPEQASWYNELQRQAATPDDAVRLADMSGRIDVEDLLGQVRVPTLVLHTRGDLVAPCAHGRLIAASIPDARFVELDSDNHILTADEPAFGTLVREARAFTQRAFAAPRQAPGAAAPLPADSGPSGAAEPVSTSARRRITVLEAEIVSPLQAFEEMDAEVALRVLGPLIESARSAIEAGGGDIVDSSDIGVTAVFGARESSEVHAVLAARVALVLRGTVDKASSGRARVRIALDTGDAIVSSADGTLVARGAVIRQARRLCYAFRRATVAISERTRQSAGGYIRAEPMDRDEYSAVSRDQTVHELLALSSAPSRWHLRAHRSLTRFVGREAECELLEQYWRRACGGRGQVVLKPASASRG